MPSHCRTKNQLCTRFARGASGIRRVLATGQRVHIADPIGGRGVGRPQSLVSPHRSQLATSKPANRPGPHGHNRKKQAVLPDYSRGPRQPHWHQGHADVHMVPHHAHTLLDNSCVAHAVKDVTISCCPILTKKRTLLLRVRALPQDSSCHINDALVQSTEFQTSESQRQQLFARNSLKTLPRCEEQSERHPCAARSEAHKGHTAHPNIR
mmetsp:Transcript_86023/g.230157  ORF Transcript_86023/g.230157 Transcript_86023/m.230157 type:complete len:209 (-) Transcript_86023:104-730(-)